MNGNFIPPEFYVCSSFERQGTELIHFEAEAEVQINWNSRENIYL